MKKCNKLGYTHHFCNGGMLVCRDFVSEGLTDYLICTVDENNNLIGFLALASNFCNLNDLYVLQIAVDKKYLNSGIASNMIAFAIEHSLGYDCMCAGVRKDNISSNGLFCKKGFILDDNSNENFYIYDLKKVEKRKKITEKVFAKR